MANACTTANPADLKLFVDLLDHYLFFFEKNNPSITGNYLTGLVALVQENLVSNPAVGVAKAQFLEIIRYIKRKKESPETSQKFADVDVSSVST